MPPGLPALKEGDTWSVHSPDAPIARLSVTRKSAYYETELGADVLALVARIL
jgi:hypothetical protein